MAGVNAGSHDAFLAKYDSSGEQLWVRQFGSAAYEELESVATDLDGNVYVAGHTQGSLAGVNAGSYDAFLAKYDSSGEQLWVRQFGSAVYDELESIATDLDGNVFT